MSGALDQRLAMLETKVKKLKGREAVLEKSDIYSLIFLPFWYTPSEV